MGFTCAYVYFIKENLSVLLQNRFDWDVTPNEVAMVCWIVFTLLCLVRKIEKFAATHIFADAMILITLIVVISFATVNLRQTGSRLDTVYAFNPVTWSSSIGFAVYAYEGIGMILPVQDITAKPEQYTYVVISVISVTCAIYIFFGLFCNISWGDQLTTPLITDQLTSGDIAPVWVGQLIQILYTLNLLFSFPLVLYPTIMINENYLFDNWGKTPKRQWFKNLERFLQVGFVVGLTISLGNKLDKFLSILGALACTPVAFLFPSYFHYKLCAQTTKQKFIDLALVGMSVVIQIYCTVDGLLNWND